MSKPSCFGSGDPERCYNREAHDRCDFSDECDEINYGADETKIDYTAFHMDNCRMCGSQRCSGDHEAIDMCGKNPNSDYAKITREMAKWPTWKKQVYNERFATGLHSKKLIIGEENMATNIGGIGYIDTAAVCGGAKGGSGFLPTVMVDGKKFEADNTCKTCANKGICKYVDYYSGLITSTQQISVDSNFELRLWCKQYRNETGIRG